MKLLHWLYLISYLTCVSCLSLIFLNKNLFSLVVLGEVVIILIYLLSLILASYVNVYYLVGFSFFVLILAGLELVLNILVIMVN